MAPTPAIVASSGSYFARHWRGELSLPKSYWINGIIIGLVCCVILSGALVGFAAAAVNAITTLPALFFVLALLLNIAIVIWVIVGIWRSAGRYVGPKFWAILARVTVVIVLMGGVFIEVSNFSNLVNLMSSAE
jgi:hypothetical protein